MIPNRLFPLILALLLLATPLAADDLETEVARMARIGGCWSPSFSPDGSRIAFISDMTGVPQVWTMPSTGGWPELLTAFDDQISTVSWSPAADQLVFVMAPGGGLNQQLYLISPDGQDLKRLTDGGKEANWLGRWSHDGALLSLASNRADPRTMDSYLYDLAAGELRLAAKNPGVGALVDLSRDGRRGVLWRMQSRSDNNLLLLDLASGEEALLTPHEAPGSFGGGLFSPDGGTVYLFSNKDRDLAAFARVPLDAKGRPQPIEILAARDGAELQGFTLTTDGKTAALLWNAGGRSALDFFDVESSTLVPGPELPAEIASGLTFSRDGRRLAMVVSGAASPRNIWVLERAEGSFRQLTRSPHAGIGLDSLARPELVHYRAHDGLELSGWLYRPPPRDGAPLLAPYVLSFHGGPEGQERPSFRSVYQALLRRGIGVFAPNVRGSSGFGKRFVNLDNGVLRFDGIRDIESSVRFLVASGLANPTRLGIMGGSYGGYMTMAGLAFYPNLFAAGANLFGVINFETFFANTEGFIAAISTVEYGDPVKQAEMLRDLSPIHKVDQVRAPTLVLHGANDTNVPVVEAEQVVESLKRRGVPVEYVLFPDEGHGFRKTANRIRSDVEIVKWFEKYLK